MCVIIILKYVLQHIMNADSSNPYTVKLQGYKFSEEENLLVLELMSDTLLNVVQKDVLNKDMQKMIMRLCAPITRVKNHPTYDLVNYFNTSICFLVNKIIRQPSGYAWANTNYQNGNKHQDNKGDYSVDYF